MQLLIEEMQSACATLVREAKETNALNWAVGYAQAGAAMNDPKEIQIQCLYILNNMQHWRGPAAKKCREVFKRLANPKTWRA